MLKYVLIKLCLVIPVVVLIALAVFFISNLAPGDRVKEYLELYGTSSSDDKRISDSDYEKTAEILNLDKPAFYFSVQPKSYPDTLYRIVQPEKRKLALMFLEESMSWQEAYAITNAIYDLEHTDVIYQKHDYKEFIPLKAKIETLINSKSSEEFDNNFIELKDISVGEDFPLELRSKIDELSTLIGKRKLSDKSQSEFLPNFVWHGTENRFHKWFGKLIKFDPGISVIDGRNVRDKIKDAFPLTFTYVLMAYFFTFLIAIPFGILSSFYRKNIFVNAFEIMFSAFYSVPLFWLSTLAVIFFTTSEVIGIFNVFPSIGVGFLDPEDTILNRVFQALPHLILPALVVAFHSGAYLSLLIKRNLDKEMSDQYFISLIAKGIPKARAVLFHAFPNSILSLVTVIIMGFPAALAGSVIVEVIFNIPGMGRLLYESLVRNDWNVVFAIVILIGVITYIFYLAGDLIYNFLNPKIRYS